MRVPNNGRVLALLLAFALVAASCSESADDTADAPAPTVESEPRDAAPSADDGTGNDTAAGDTPLPAEAAERQWLLDYLGTNGGTATGDPVKIGWVNSSAAFPDLDRIAAALAEFVNNELGGVDGRPLELVTCASNAPEDGARCGAELANNEELALVFLGGVLEGNADLYSSLSGLHPVHTSVGLATADYTTPVATSYVSGPLGGTLGGINFIRDDLAPTKVAAVVTDDTAGRGGFPILEAGLSEAGIEVAGVFVDPAASGPEVESAMLAAGAEDADAIIIGLFAPACVSAYDALVSLGLQSADVAVVTTSQCWDSVVREHLENLGVDGMLPDGWYFSWYGFNPFQRDLASGMASVAYAMEQAGVGDLVENWPLFTASFLTVVKVLSSVGGDHSFEVVDNAFREFEGPAMAIAGPQRCGDSTVFPSVCQSRISIHQYTDGGWVNTRQGDDSIDIAVDLMMS